MICFADFVHYVNMKQVDRWLQGQELESLELFMINIENGQRMARDIPITSFVESFLVNHWPPDLILILPR